MRKNMGNKWSRTLMADWDFKFSFDWLSFDRPRMIKPKWSAGDAEFLEAFMKVLRRGAPDCLFSIESSEYEDDDYGELIRYHAVGFGRFDPDAFLKGLDAMWEGDASDSDMIELRMKWKGKKWSELVYYMNGKFWTEE